MASAASQYISKLLNALSSGAITELKDKQLKRIAAIITGLTIVSNPKYHSIIKLQPGELEKIKTSITSKQIADRVATIGTRSPSMLAQNEIALIHWNTRSPTTKTAVGQQLKRIAAALDNSPPVATNTKKEVHSLPSPQPNLSKPPV